MKTHPPPLPGLAPIYFSPSVVTQKQEVIVCSSYESFYDLCENNLVEGRDVHCVFRMTRNECYYLKELWVKKGGGNMTVSTSLLILNDDHV